MFIGSTHWQQHLDSMQGGMSFRKCCNVGQQHADAKQWESSGSSLGIVQSRGWRELKSTLQQAGRRCKVLRFWNSPVFAHWREHGRGPNVQSPPCCIYVAVVLKLFLVDPLLDIIQLRTPRPAQNINDYDHVCSIWHCKEKGACASCNSWLVSPNKRSTTRKARACPWCAFLFTDSPFSLF